MADGFDLNNQSKAGDALPQIPTSASEVAVRTMASDIEMMGQSGGMAGVAAPQAMQVPVTLHENPAAASVPGASSMSGAPMAAPAPIVEEVAAKKSAWKAVVITIVVIAAMAGLFALGYFVLGK